MTTEHEHEHDRYLDRGPDSTLYCGYCKRLMKVIPLATIDIVEALEQQLEAERSLRQDAASALTDHCRGCKEGVPVEDARPDIGAKYWIHFREQPYMFTECKLADRQRNMLKTLEAAARSGIEIRKQ